MSHVRKPLAIAAALNTTIFVVGVVGGVKGHSNSLIMDGVDFQVDKVIAHEGADNCLV